MRRRPGIHLENTSAHTTLRWGNIVEDVDDPSSEMVIVSTPSARAYEWDVSLLNRTVAEDNPEYPPTDWVVVCVYRDELDAEFPYYDGHRPLSLRKLSRESNVNMYSFPESRVRVVGRVKPPKVPIDEIHPSPYHARTFSVDDNREFIETTRKEGRPLGLPMVRKVEDGFETINGHKRIWVSERAGLEEIPVQVLDIDDRRAADLWAKHHYDRYTEQQQEAALNRLVDRFGITVFDKLHHLSPPA